MDGIALDPVCGRVQPLRLSRNAEYADSLLKRIVEPLLRNLESGSAGGTVMPYIVYRARACGQAHACLRMYAHNIHVVYMRVLENAMGTTRVIASIFARALGGRGFDG